MAAKLRSQPQRLSNKQFLSQFPNFSNDDSRYIVIYMSGWRGVKTTVHAVHRASR
jgi:hypothetical protein